MPKLKTNRGAAKRFKKTGSGGFIEIQGTAEKDPFDDKQLGDLLALADKGIKELVEVQKKAVGDLL